MFSNCRHTENGDNEERKKNQNYYLWSGVWVIPCILLSDNFIKYNNFD